MVHISPEHVQSKVYTPVSPPPFVPVSRVVPTSRCHPHTVLKQRANGSIIRSNLWLDQ